VATRAKPCGGGYPLRYWRLRVSPLNIEPKPWGNAAEVASDDEPVPQLPADTAAGDRTGLPTALVELYGHLSAERRRQFYLVLALMLMGAAAELATIGAVIPFIALLADPTLLGELPWAVEILGMLGAETDGERILAATAVFVFFAFLAGLLRILLAGKTQEFVFRLGHEISVEIQRRILFQPYSYHFQTNTSAILSAVHKIEVLIFNLLLPLMQAVTGGFIAAVIVAALIFVDPVVALSAAAGFSLIYLLVSTFSRRRLGANSAAMGSAWDERLKIIQESLGGIRDVIIDNSQAMHLRTFERVSARLSDARANTAFISVAPRFVIESAGMAVIAIIALALSQRAGGIAAALPLLGALTLGAQRLLPLIQQVYTGWSTSVGYSSALRQTLGLLRLSLPPDEISAPNITPLPFKKKISIEKVSFAYPTRDGPALEDISFEISCGSSVALIGPTGSGKSTLADLLMGLLEPDEGKISVDGVPLTWQNRRRWQSIIAHVPQSIFLADASIARNIAMTSDNSEIDFPRAVDAATKAQLHEFIASLSEGYETIVGERGIRLSGGQRQRLGIARAIYKQAPVLVLDEATSALDQATEKAVMDSLHQLGDKGRTIIVIAHRPSTIARCDLVARFHGGGLLEVGSFLLVAGAGNTESEGGSAV
jgi:ATP-binding cassette, subfamily B, bacterial PglK